MADNPNTTNPSPLLCKPHPDVQVLRAVETWHLARGKLKAAYASRSLEGTTCNTEVQPGWRAAYDRVSECIENMKEAEDDLLGTWPSTLSGIRELVAIAAEIEAHRLADDESYFGTGPVLSILSCAAECISGIQDRLEGY